MAISVLIPTTPDREEQLARCIAAVKASGCDQRIDIFYERNNYEGFVKPVMRMLKQVRGMCLILGNDCVVRRDAIQNLWNASLKVFPKDDGLCTGVDERPNTIKLPRHPFAHSRTLLENIYPKYFHNFVDKDLGQVMWRKGKFLVVESAVIEHHHYTVGKSEKDFTYEIGQATSDADGEIYAQRLARGFDLKPEEVVADFTKYPKGPF
jgi:hypothetical protein